jgi:hypothetical protein
LRTVGVDYRVVPDAARYLLEVDHVPNVTVFAELREAYLDLVVRWAGEATSQSGSLTARVEMPYPSR